MRILISFLPAILISISVIHANEVTLYHPPKTVVENLDEDLGSIAKTALRRINQYREAAGLPLWTYDEKLSEMGQAHAEYMLVNCQAKNNYFGHFENPSFPGYSKKGDEAARTSGLTGGPDPLYGLESLIAGVYHRIQFLRPEKKRIGIGFTLSKDKRCGGCLFVSRPRSNGWIYGNPRFILFPPNGFTDTLSVFIREWPDPLPIKKHGPTGYIISITMHYKDVRNFVKVKAFVLNEKGDRVSAWITDPRNPSVRSIGTSGKYATDMNVKSNIFAKNFNSIFIMPKRLLIPGMKYRIKAEITIGSTTENLDWWFRVRNNSIWQIDESRNDPLSSFNFALTHSIDGDTIQFKEGTHILADSCLWLDKDITIAGKGPFVSTVKRLSQYTHSCIAAFKNAKIVIRDMTLDAKNYMFFSRDNGTIHFINCKIINRSNGYFAMVHDKGVLKFTDCDFGNFHGPWFVYLKNRNTKVIMSSSNKGNIPILLKYSRGKGNKIIE